MYYSLASVFLCCSVSRSPFRASATLRRRGSRVRSEAGAKRGRNIFCSCYPRSAAAVIRARGALTAFCSPRLSKYVFQSDVIIYAEIPPLYEGLFGAINKYDVIGVSVSWKKQDCKQSNFSRTTVTPPAPTLRPGINLLPGGQLDWKDPAFSFIPTHGLLSPTISDKYY